MIATIVRERGVFEPETAQMRLARPPMAVMPLVTLLRELARVLEATTDEQYCRKPVGVVSASIGGHVRHSLDHIEAVLDGIYAGVIDYDSRARGTTVESNRQAALDAIDRLKLELLGMPAIPEHLPLRLKVLLTSDGPSMEVTTCLGREMAFALSHTVHHNALIAVIAKTIGIPLPERFGYAPSTIAHLEKTTCAQ
jgi:hypothetical protein